MNTNVPVRINSPSVVSETIDGEVIIINLDSGAYYSLWGTAAAIWELVERRETSAAIVADISHQYDGDDARIHSEVSRFLEQLEVEALIVPNGDKPVEDHESSKPGVTGLRPAFESPNLSKYTDMEHFLQVDPIHEVGDHGWPNLKK